MLKYVHVFLSASFFTAWVMGMVLSCNYKMAALPALLLLCFFLGSEESYSRRYDQTGERGWS